jgi:hypothetical protein
MNRALNRSKIIRDSHGLEFKKLNNFRKMRVFFGGYCALYHSELTGKT